MTSKVDNMGSELDWVGFRKTSLLGESGATISVLLDVTLFRVKHKYLLTFVLLVLRDVTPLLVKVKHQLLPVRINAVQVNGPVKSVVVLKMIFTNTTTNTGRRNSTCSQRIVPTFFTINTR